MRIAARIFLVDSEVMYEKLFACAAVSSVFVFMRRRASIPRNIFLERGSDCDDYGDGDVRK